MIFCSYCSSLAKLTFNLLFAFVGGEKRSALTLIEREKGEASLKEENDEMKSAAGVRDAKIA